MVAGKRQTAAANFTFSTCFPIRAARACTSGIRKATPPRTFSPATNARCGFNVLHPMGWDAFGLPAEQYAVKTGQHPRKTTEANIATFKRQIQSLGFSYDWSRELATTDPDYFKWTQWIFLKLYNSWFNPETNKAEPIETLKYPAELGRDELPRVRADRQVSPTDDANVEAKRREYRDSKRLAYVSEATRLVVRATRHGSGQRRSRGRQKRSRRISRRPQADAPMDAPHHRLCRAIAGRPRHD